MADAGIDGLSGSVKIGDVNNNTLRITNSAARSIDFAHAKIHAGLLFSAHASAAAATSGIGFWMKLTTATTDTYEKHMVFDVETDQSTLIEFVEDVSTTDGASTATTFWNHDRVSTQTGTLGELRTVESGATTVPTGGLQLDEFYAGGTGFKESSPGKGGRAEEWILKANTRYMIHAVPAAAAGVSIRAIIYKG